MRPFFTRGGYIYVLGRSDGGVKIGLSNNVGRRHREHSADMRYPGVRFRILWVSRWLPSVAVVEGRIKEALGSRPWGKGSREAFRITPQRAIQAAKRVLSEVEKEVEPEVPSHWRLRA